MRYYVRAEIERFLTAVDRALRRRATVIVIGGGAAALKYRIDDPTTDIDTFNALGAELRRALMKTVRGDQADFAKLQAIHEKKPFDLSVLLRRYEQEMSHVVIDPRRLRWNFLALVESLFPEAVTLVQGALERPDQRGQLDAFLASQASVKRPRRSRQRPGRRR